MNVVIFEPWHTGHRYDYLRRVIPPIKEMGVDLTVVSSQEGFSSQEFEIHLRNLDSLFDKLECPSPIVNKKLQTRRQLRQYFSQVILAQSHDHIYVPSADLIAEALLLLSPSVRRKLPFMEGLHLFGGFGYPRSSLRDTLKGYFDGLVAALAPWSVYAHLDPWQLAALFRRYPSVRRRAVVMPDPVDAPVDITAHAAREQLGIPTDGIYLGSAGPMNTRKGIDLLLHAFSAALVKLPHNARLLLAGPFEPSLRYTMNTQFSEQLRKKRIVVIDRHLSQREISIIIPAMDVVCTPYPYHVGSSGIALRAAASHRPILATNRYWLKNMVETFGLGHTCNVLDNDSFEQGIQTAFREREHYRRPTIADRYLQFQSHDNFVATWTGQLRNRCGLAPDTQRIDWEWVLKGA